MDAIKTSTKRDRLTGMLIGALVGVGAGILLAPASGQETRQRIKGKANEVANEVRASAARIQEGAKEMVAAGRERFSSSPSIESTLNRIDDELKAQPI